MKLIIIPMLAAMLIHQDVKKKVVFFGDSITEAGVQPGGYIVKTGELAAKDGKADQYEFIGSGIGGNKVYDLYLRLEEDILSKNPDIVVIYIGVNDIWHKQTHGTGTDHDKFQKFYAAIIKKLQDKNCKVILATPAVIGEKNDFTNPLDPELSKYCLAIEQLAKKNNLPLVDLRKKFMYHSKSYNTQNKESGILTTDGVHLNEKGNEMAATEMWKAIKEL